VDRSLHAALDKYAFFGVTGSLDTLTNLIQRLEASNKYRQDNCMNVWKQTREGSLMYVESDLPYKETNVNWPSSSEYLRFQCSIRISGVPDQSVLTVYNKVVRSQSQDLYDWVRSYFTTVTCKRGFPLNPLLVILNAESKFRRHLREVPAPPTLPGDVMELMSKTLQLLELIYWDPIARLGTPEMIGFPMTPPWFLSRLLQIWLGIRDGDSDDVPTLQQG